jgi:hypothetical protein
MDAMNVTSTDSAGTPAAPAPSMRPGGRRGPEMMKRLFPAVAATVMAAVVAVPAPAHADDNSYLARLNESGVPIPVPDNVRLSSGRYMCAQLRMYSHTGTLRGGSQQELVRQLTNVFFYSPEAADVQIQAAQSELCPDTLH